ncbi:MAG: redox-regulated ATPase YchF [Flavobacteriales bacterium]
MKCGIVGLPNVGKSTLFNSLSDAKAQAANFPFCTIEPNIGKVHVPDARLYELAELVKPQRVVPATVEMVDIAGLVKGASQGEGLGNPFLAHIRETNALIHVLRCFEDDHVAHVDGSVDPVRDKEIVDIELQLKDLETVVKRLDRVRRAVHSGDKAAREEWQLLQGIRQHLEAGKSVRSMGFSVADRARMNGFQLLTSKPVLYVCNVDPGAVKTGNSYTERVEAAVADERAEILVLAVAAEAEIAALDTFADRQLFLTDLGLKESGAPQLIRAAYRLLNLQTYFTAGAEEVRAWTIHSGDRAPQAAGVIHSDFERGFIRAEVIAYGDYIAQGSAAQVREAGKMRVAGKEYIVQDGDVMHFRFSV